MDTSKGSFALVLAIVAITFSCPVETMPVILPGPSNQGNVGPRITVSNIAELNLLLNHTVPDVLTSRLKPYEYLQQRGHNVTGMDILPYVISDYNNSNGLRFSAVSQSNSCPVMWTANMEANRDPAIIHKAVCNGQGTTCLNSNGQPVCEELSIQYKVKRFLGLKPDGTQVWQWQYQTIPVACSCSGV